MDHGLGNVQTLLVVAHQPSPADHPAEGPSDDPPTRDRREPDLLIGSPYDLDDKIEEHCFVQKSGPVVGTIGKQVLEPGPAFAEAIQDELSTGAVRNVGCCEVHHEQSPVRIDGDVPLAANDLLAAVLATRQ